MSLHPNSEKSSVATVTLCALIIFIEGRDETNFFAALLSYMYPGAKLEIIDALTARTQQYIVRNVQPGVDVELREIGGKEQFLKKLPLFFADRSSDQVKAYIIVQDADASVENTLKGIQSLLKNHGQPCPAKHGEFVSNAEGTQQVGIFIMPGPPASSGMLEDLCLLSVANHPIMPHVMDYIDKVKVTMGANSPKNPSKSSVLVFLAGQHEYVTSLGLAAQRRMWPFDDTAFVNLCEFLTQFFAF